MAPTLPTVRQYRRVRLPAGSAAAGEARRQVRAAIDAWDVPVDPDIAVLLTSELVTNAIQHEPGDMVTLAITCTLGQLRVDVYDAGYSLPVQASPAADSGTGRGLMLVDALSTEWGFYRTPAGKAVYFTLASQPDLMTRRQVAYLFRVTSSAVATWARRGRLAEVRDEDGRPQYRPADVDALRRLLGEKARRP